ncbi:hypothetical protein [Shewanella glacialipiscicola]|uniref:hypothetical protein n=1 Tax=Shewanella glacialipiscicola TaxID=614069 RepID=UPI003D7BF978
MNKTISAFYLAREISSTTLPDGFCIDVPDNYIDAINEGYKEVTGNDNSPVYRDFSTFIAHNPSPLDSEHRFKMIIRKGDVIHAIFSGHVSDSQDELHDLIIFPLTSSPNPLIIHWVKLWLKATGMFKVIRYTRTYDNPNHGKPNFVDEHLGVISDRWVIRRNPITGDVIFASSENHFLTDHASNLQK